MDIDTLKKGIAIKEQLDERISQKEKLIKLYQKKENLTQEQLETLFSIAISNTTFAIQCLHDAIKIL